MNTNEQILKLVSEMTSSINEQFPNTITEEQRSIIMNHYLTSNKPLNIIQQELSNYTNELKTKLSSTKVNKYSFDQIKSTLNNLNNLNKFSNYDLYIDSDITPYLMLNQSTSKSYDSLDMLIDLKDIEKFRDKMKNTPYYDNNLDTKNFVKDGNDYGFKLNVDNVLINISPYIKDKDSITKYTYKDNKFVVEDIKDNTNYLKTYKVNGEDINSVSLEYIKRYKDIEKDIEVSTLIDKIGYSYDVYNSIIPNNIIKEVETNNINNTPSNEVVRNSLVNFMYDVKMNDKKDIPEDKLDAAIERLHNKPYDTIKNYLAKAKDRLNNKIELPKVLYDQKIENNLGTRKSLGFSNTKNLSYTLIISGIIICLLAFIFRII